MVGSRVGGDLRVVRVIVKQSRGVGLTISATFKTLMNCHLLSRF